MNNYDFDRFTTRLYEEFFCNPEAVTGHEWKGNGRRKQCRAHLLTDGHDAHDKNGTIITGNAPGIMIDGSTGEAMNVVKYYEKDNGLQWKEAVQRMANIYGVLLPSSLEETEEQRARRERRQARARRIISLKPTQTATQTATYARRQSVTDYLRGRGITDEEAQQWRITYIGDDSQDQDAAAKLKAVKDILKDEGVQDSRIGTLYDIAMPYFFNGRAIGIVLTTTREGIQRRNDEERQRGQKLSPKYTRYKFDRSDTNANSGAMYGLHPSRGHNLLKSLVVCEGYMDVIAATAALADTDKTDVAGITSNTISAQQAREIRRAGYNHVILIPDYEGDKGGKGIDIGTRATVDAVTKDAMILNAEGISVTIANLMDDANPGAKHDANSFICAFGVEAFMARLQASKHPTMYCYALLRTLFEKTFPTFTAIDKFRAQKEFANIIATTDNTFLVDELLNDLPVSIFDNKQAAQQAVNDAIEQQQKERDYKARTAAQTAAADYYTTAAQNVQQGRLKEATAAADEARAAMDGAAAKYLHLLHTPTQEEYMQQALFKGGELSTGYTLKNSTDEEELTLPRGAITLVGGATGHGKSTFLQNIALQVVKDKDTPGAVLFFSYEEDHMAVIRQMINKFADLQLCRNYDRRKSNNLRAIEDYFKTGKPTYISFKMCDQFDAKVKEFFDDYLSSGRLRIYYEDLPIEDLTAAITGLSKRMQIKAIFVDFLQLLYSKGARAQRLQRTEELKLICNSLKKLAINLNVAVVAAVQLNRETTTPTALASQRIAEAADIERLANKIVCIWNSNEKPYKFDAELTKFEKEHFTCGTPGFLYAKLTKNRSGINGLEALLNWDGNTGVIS